MSEILKPGPFKRIVKVQHSPWSGYGTFQFGTAIDSRVFYPPNAGLNLNLDVFAFVFSQTTFPEKWLATTNKGYALSYRNDSGVMVEIIRAFFVRRWFATYSFMNNVEVGGRVLPPGPFLDANAQSTGAVPGYDLDYGLINLGYRYKDAGLSVVPDTFMRIKHPEPFLGKTIKITFE